MPLWVSFPFGLAQHVPISSCQQRQNLKIVPAVLKTKKPYPNLPSLPLPLSHPPEPSAREVSGTAHFCSAQEKQNGGSTLAPELSAGLSRRPGQKMSDLEECQQGAEGVNQVGEEFPGESER